MEDVSAKVLENKKLLAQQLSLENFLINEAEVLEMDLQGADLQRDMDGEIVLPTEVMKAMREMGKKVEC